MLSKIQHSSAVINRPTNSTSGNIGYFRDEDLGTNTAATVVTKEFLNDIIDELGAVIAWGNLTPSYGSTTQVRDAIQYNIDLKINKTTADTYYVKIAGDTMTGLLTLSGDPSTPLQAATKQYADTKLALTGGTLTGPLVLSGAPTINLHPATKQYVDDTTVGITGDAMTGFLTLHADPVNAMHAATKQYVDNQPIPSYETVTWTDYVDVSTGTYLNQWGDVRPAWSITVPTGKRLLFLHDFGINIRAFGDGTTGSGTTMEWRLLVNNVEQDIVYTNFYHGEDAGTYIQLSFVLPVTGGQTLSLKLQCKSHANQGRVYTNSGQWPSAGPGGVSRFKILYF